MCKFEKLSDSELMEIDGGFIWIIIAGAAALGGGFAAGYGLSRWLGWSSILIALYLIENNNI